MRNETIWRIGAYRDKVADAFSGSADWVCTNTKFGSEKEAFEFIADMNRRYSPQVLHFYVSIQQTRTFDTFTYDAIPIKLRLK